MRSKKSFLSIGILALVLFLGVGYAVVSSVYLNIGGTASVSDTELNVEITNAVASTNISNKTLNFTHVLSNKNLTSNFTLNGMELGEEVRITYTVTNNETDVDAELSLASGVELSNTNSDYFDVGYEITDAITNLENNDKTMTVVVTVELIKTPVTEANCSTTVGLTLTASPVGFDSSSGNIDNVGTLGVNFETDGWSTVVQALKSGNHSYQVGNTKTVDMGSFGTHTIRIANLSTPSECSQSDFSQTACGVVLEFADVITTYNMNTNMTNVGGWPASEMRTYVNNDIYNVLPTELKSAIIDTKVVSGHGKSNYTNFTSTDKLYLLSTAEIYGAQETSNPIGCDTAQNNTRKLDYYASLGVTTSNYSGAIKQYNGSNKFWRLRDARSNSIYGFYIVRDGGDWTSSNADITGGVAPAFRI